MKEKIKMLYDKDDKAAYKKLFPILKRWKSECNK